MSADTIDPGLPPSESNEPKDPGSIARKAVTLLPSPAPGLVGALETYIRLLLDANEGVNLVSRKDTARHVARFTAESLFLARLLSEELAPRRVASGPVRLLDIGSGGGFPGLVLKLALPSVETTLVEGTQKKARFLAETCRKLDLRGITVLWARAEALVNPSSPSFAPGMRRQFQWVTAKALGPLRESLDLAAPFLRPQGEHWTFKGANHEAETKASRRRLAQLHCRLLRVERIPGDEDSFLVAVQRLPEANVSRETTLRNDSDQDE